MSRINDTLRDSITFKIDYPLALRDKLCEFLAIVLKEKGFFDSPEFDYHFKNNICMSPDLRKVIDYLMCHGYEITVHIKQKADNEMD